MTVLRPSLPPVSSTRTRTLSLPASAARAVLATNSGTKALAASRDEPCRARVRNSRRWIISCILWRVEGLFTSRGRWQSAACGLAVGCAQLLSRKRRQPGSAQLVFRHGHDHVGGV